MSLLSNMLREYTHRHALCALTRTCTAAAVIDLSSHFASLEYVLPVAVCCCCHLISFSLAVFDFSSLSWFSFNLFCSIYYSISLLLLLWKYIKGLLHFFLERQLATCFLQCTAGCCCCCCCQMCQFCYLAFFSCHSLLLSLFLCS